MKIKSILTFLLFLFFTFQSQANPLADSGNLYTHLNTFTLNGKNIIESKDKIYFFSIPYPYAGTDTKLKVNFDTEGNDYQLKINNQNIVNGQDFIFENATSADGHKVEIFKGDNLLTTEKLVLTGLPIVQLYSDGNELSRKFSKGRICVHEGAKVSTGEMLNCEMRYRGSSALLHEKKSFAIKLRDKNFNSTDRSYFGLRDDNYWILDAMAVDKSRMRNRICFDLWNDFSTDPYYKTLEKKMINGTRGNYVEVFLDDEYWGLYCMTERIDRKQLKLQKYNENSKTIKGVLYKSAEWSYATMMGYVPGRGANPSYWLPYYNNSSDIWEKYEVKYPDFEGGQNIDWKPLYDAVYLSAKGIEYEFSKQVAGQFDLPVWLDYYLLMEFILATDNHGKNAYFSIYDITNEQKLLITPWDMDGVLGIRWNGEKVSSKNDYITYIKSNEHGEHNLFRRLKENNIEGFNDKLKTRYKELSSTYFSEQSLKERINYYMEMFEKSGAATREAKRWKDIDFEKETAYLHQWISERTSYLEKQYTNIVNPNAEEIKVKAYPNPVINYLYVKNIQPETSIQIFTSSGICIYSGEVKSDQAILDFSTYSSGTYYLKVGKEGKVILKTHH